MRCDGDLASPQSSFVGSASMLLQMVSSLLPVCQAAPDWSTGALARSPWPLHAPQQTKRRMGMIYVMYRPEVYLWEPCVVKVKKFIITARSNARSPHSECFFVVIFFCLS